MSSFCCPEIWQLLKGNNSFNIARKGMLIRPNANNDVNKDSLIKLKPMVHTRD